MRSIEFNYALHRRRDIPLIPVGLRTRGKWMEVQVWVSSLCSKNSPTRDRNLLKDGRRGFEVKKYLYLF